MWHYLVKCGGHRWRNFFLKKLSALLATITTRATDKIFANRWSKFLLRCEENLGGKVVHTSFAQNADKVTSLSVEAESTLGRTFLSVWRSTSLSCFLVPLLLWRLLVSLLLVLVATGVGTNSTSTASLFWSFFRLLDLGRRATWKESLLGCGLSETVGPTKGLAQMWLSGWNNFGLRWMGAKRKMGVKWAKNCRIFPRNWPKLGMITRHGICPKIYIAGFSG